MKRLGRTVTIVVIFILSVWVWFSTGIHEYMLIRGTLGVFAVDKAKKRTTYAIGDKDWATFPLAKDGKLLKIISNANIDKNITYRNDAVWRYALAWEVIDKKNKVLASNIHHQRTKKLRLFDVDNKRWLPGAFYLSEGKLTPADSRIMIINLQNIRRASAVKLRVHSKDPDVKSVSVRVYEQRKPSERKLARIWKRMGDKRRKEVSRANVYPVELIRENEIKNLVRNSYKPVGPTGADGDNYNTMKMYVLDDEEQHIVQPHGLVVQKDVDGVIPIPEDGGEIRLEFTSTYNGTGTIEPVRVTWYGKGIGNQSTMRLPWQGKHAMFSRIYEGGLIVISSEQSLVVRAFLKLTDKLLDITPRPKRVRAYIAREGKPVEYIIQHVRGLKASIRFDMRTIIQDEAGNPEPGAARVRYEWLDRKGRTIKHGNIVFTPQRSQYDSLLSKTEQQISNPHRIYASLSSRVARVRFVSDGAVSIVGYTRPSGAIHSRKVPEDYYPFGAEVQRLPSWYQFRPVEFDELLRTNRTLRISLQYRPPKDHPDLLIGYYDWEPYFPQGSWLARYLLVPRQDSIPIRDEARGSVFHEIQLNKKIIMDFKHFPGVNELTPTMIVLRNDSRPRKLSVHIDGKPVLNTVVTARRLNINLPAMTSGRHELKVKTNIKAKILLNHIKGQMGAYVKRLGIKFNTNRLRFLFRKVTKEREVVSAEYFPPLTTSSRVSFRISILGFNRKKDRPLAGWTFRENEYDVRLKRGTVLPVLSTQMESVQEGSKMFLVFGADLEPGNYPIEFELKGKPGGYLSLYRMIPGQKERQHIFEQTVSGP